jgi:UDP-N-acetylmuramoyl-L-alanyl-D-glutamate--2,6-diaminopimelate ligase
VTDRPPIPLETLLAPIRQAGLVEAATGDLSTPVAHLAHDSRVVRPDTCFFAIPGGQADGHAFLETAAREGATVAVGERPLDEVPAGFRASIRVSSARAAMAEAAAVFYGRPADHLALLGITGTNGKTTVAYLLHDALTALGQRAGLIGTIEVRIGDRTFEATHTTPDALAVHGMLAEMVGAGCSACAMEVSSHALEQERVRGARFTAAVFTNLTHDHLDFHGSFEAYTAAKARLFAGLDEDATAVINADDPSWPFMVTDTRAAVHTYGTQARGAERAAPAGDLHVAYRIDENRLDGLRLTIDGASRAFRLAGTFNAANLAAAYTTLRALGYRQAETLDALAEARPVPGRLESITTTGDGPIAVVDYAHTPDALANVLRTVREMVPAGGSLSVVFGCGGDRDRAKRPAMGRIAAEMADRVVLTNDNPRSEPPEAILEAIAAGMPRPPDAVLPDRAAAIRHAVAEAGNYDVVVVAGKGHETYQILGDERHAFDDREVVRGALLDRQRESAARTD